MDYKKNLLAIFSLALLLSFVACSNDSSSSSAKSPEQSQDVASVSTTVLEDGPNMLKYGSLDLDIAADSLLTVFEYGDIVTVMVVGYDTIDVPVAADYNDVSIGEYVLRVVKSSPYITFAISYGQAAATLGISADSKFPIDLVIQMKEKGGYLENLEMLKFMTDADSIEAYPELSVAEYANFREVKTTGMGEGVLYRSSNPVNPMKGRNRYADSLAEVAGVVTFINLADSKEEAEAYEGFAESYYAKQNVVFLDLPVAFTSKAFKAGFVKGLRYMVENEGPYLVHCTLGKDRAGFTAAVLEALMGATATEIKDDYAKTYTNYFSVVDGRQVALTKDQLDWVKGIVITTMQTAYKAEDVDISDFDKADLATATEKYMLSLGLEKDEIETLKKHLK
jgi:hypothetical protein